jgi:hypothetical protein
VHAHPRQQRSVSVEIKNTSRHHRRQAWRTLYDQAGIAGPIDLNGGGTDALKRNGERSATPTSSWTMRTKGDECASAVPQSSPGGGLRAAGGVRDGTRSATALANTERVRANSDPSTSCRVH